MFDDPVIYKVLIVILLIALGIMLFMYMQRPNCTTGRREGMHTVQAQAQALQVDRPWTDTIDDGSYHSAGTQGLGRRPFLSNRSYARSEQRRPLQRLDEIYGEYEEQVDDYDYDDDYTPSGYERIDDYVADTAQNRRSLRRLPINNNAVPTAHDSNPDLSMCPPCSCPGDAGSGSHSHSHSHSRPRSQAQSQPRSQAQSQAQSQSHPQRRRYRRKN